MVSFGVHLELWNQFSTFVITRILVALRATHARRHCAFGRPRGVLSKHLGDILGTLEVLRRLYKQGLNFSDTQTHTQTDTHNSD